MRSLFQTQCTSVCSGAGRPADAQSCDWLRSQRRLAESRSKRLPSHLRTQIQHVTQPFRSHKISTVLTQHRQGAFRSRATRRQECGRAVGHVLPVRLNNERNHLARWQQKKADQFRQLASGAAVQEEQYSICLTSLIATGRPPSNGNVLCTPASILATIQHSTVQHDVTTIVARLYGYFDPSNALQYKPRSRSLRAHRDTVSQMGGSSSCPSDPPSGTVL